MSAADRPLQVIDHNVPMPGNYHQDVVLEILGILPRLEPTAAANTALGKAIREHPGKFELARSAWLFLSYVLCLIQLYRVGFCRVPLRQLSHLCNS